MSLSCFSATDLHLEITLNVKTALKIPSLCYSTQHNIIQIKIHFTSYCKQQQEGRAGCGEQLEPQFQRELASLGSTIKTL